MCGASPRSRPPPPGLFPVPCSWCRGSRPRQLSLARGTVRVRVRVVPVWGVGWVESRVDGVSWAEQCLARLPRPQCPRRWSKVVHRWCWGFSGGWRKVCWLCQLSGACCVCADVCESALCRGGRVVAVAATKLVFVCLCMQRGVWEEVGLSVGRVSGIAFIFSLAAAVWRTEGARREALASLPRSLDRTFIQRFSTFPKQLAA